MVDWNSIVVALITGGLSAGIALIGIVKTSSKTTAVLEYKVDELDKHVRAHNGLVERMVCVEQRSKSNAYRLDRLDKLVDGGREK